LDGIPVSDFGYSESLRRNLDVAYSQAGACYGFAAERCMKYTFEMDHPLRDFDVKQFRQQFYDTVVASIQATYLDARSV
jgi:aminopeptidase C